MRLKEFTVRNFRSISEGHKLPIDKNFTVLLGKNNEGKSNLLRALALAIKILKICAKSKHDFEFIAKENPICLRNLNEFGWIFNF